MTKKRIFSAIALVTLLVFYYIKEKNKTTNSIINNQKIEDSSVFNYLQSSTTGQIIKHNGYQLS